MSLPMNDEYLKRVKNLCNRTEVLFKKIRHFKELGHDTSQLYDEVKQTYNEMQSILRDLCGFYPTEGEYEADMKALQELLKPEGN